MRERLLLAGMLSLVFLLPHATAGWDSYTAEFTYLTRAPSVRAQSLGKITAPLANSPLSGAQNPATYSFCPSAGVAYSHGSPIMGGSSTTKTRGDHVAAWSPVESGTASEDSLRWVVAGELNQLNWNATAVPGLTGQILGAWERNLYLGTLSLALLLDRRTSIGASLGYYSDRIRQPKAIGQSEMSTTTAVTLTLSALHQRPVVLKDDTLMLGLGGSLVNLNRPTIDNTSGNRTELPCILRIGPSLEMRANPGVPLTLLLLAEYQTVLNSNSRTAERLGAELGIADLVALRGGYYHESQRDHSIHYDRIEELTWGIGVKVPIEKLLPATPFRLRVDWMQNPLESIDPYNAHESRTFTQYMIRIDWMR